MSIQDTDGEKKMYELSVHRYRELKHFCLQYHEMKEAIEKAASRKVECTDRDPTGDAASLIADYRRAIKLIETTAFNIGKFPGEKILKIVTENMTIRSVCPENPLEADYYVRKFFWMLSERKGV